MFKPGFKHESEMFKGVLHPWPILWLLMHFFEKLQHVDDK